MSATFWKPKPVSHRQVLAEERPGEFVSTPFNFSTAPLSQQRLLLPIYKHKKQLLYALEEYQVLVIVGETGSGKSTQIPAYLWEYGWADNGYQVVCTQPRRIAAQSLADRVASESGTKLGQEVGYSIRFEDCTSPLTRVKYVTDGILLREAATMDPLLSKYSVIMIDEAHERNLNSDVLLGIIKKIRRKRKHLRIIVCSATIDAQAFLDFFIPKCTSGGTIEANNRGTIISVDGRQHPVDIMYRTDPVSDYIRCTVEIVLQIHNLEGGGDILAFLPSGDEIDAAIRLAEESLDRNAHHTTKKQPCFLPLYGNLPQHMQSRIFQSNTDRMTRRIIFATNIAETSVTVPNVTYVIDCGYAKIPYFDPQTGFERLIVAPISQASARQRAGRSGRIGSGKCYRLYTENYFMEHMLKSTPPEIMRSNLSSFILTLKSLGIQNVLSFELMDIPCVETLAHALETLYALGALDQETRLTEKGIQMSSFPTEPRISRMLLESLAHGCAWELLGVAAALQVRSLFEKPRTQRQRLDYDAAMVSLADPSGDHVTYVNILADMGDQYIDKEHCREKFINFLSLKRAVEVRDQLAKFVRQFGKISSLGTIDPDDRSKIIRRCVTSGFFFHVAKLANDGRYYTLRGRHVVVPSSLSVLHSNGIPSEYIIFGETYDGVRGGIEIRHCSSIHARWLQELAPHYWE
jgi:ATP-dependent RNA helicase DDX35